MERTHDRKMNKKDTIRVALVCCFSNTKVREHLPLSKRKLHKFGRRLFGIPTSDLRYGDFAGWDTYMIESLRKREDIDLYVISAHGGLKKCVKRFDLEGVHYSFVSLDVSSLLKRMIPSASLWHKINPLRPIVRRIIKDIKPDIIALIGAENAQISGTVDGIKGIPLIVKCQTIYNNPERGKNGIVDKKNAYVERKIFDSLQYVSADSKGFNDLFRKMNQNAINFKWELGNILPDVKLVDKQYDFVNYAMTMSDKKGFYDAVKALAIVKIKYPQVRLNLVGGALPEEKQALINLVAQCGLSDNVSFTPFFERQEDMFQHIQQARFALLPCKMDDLSSTIRQAMHYNLPVVCYKTEGTITLNQEKECVLIAENGNVEDLADKMSKLLSDKDLEVKLRQNAKEYSARWSDDEKLAIQMVDNFKAVIDNYRKGTPIPQELIFNE